ncbi:MAG: hypothetical protein Q4B91_05480 [Atopobiaceae bacterium]|nr:hypothetical protein [Atopobiaceae bacterium]
MAEKSKNTQHISLRVPLKELSVIDIYAAANDLSRAQAVLHFVRQSIAAETGEKPVTKSDLVALAATLTKAIESQPVSVQLPPQPPPPALESSKQKKRPWWRFWG